MSKTRRIVKQALWCSGGLALALALSSCDPCRQLAELSCDCLPTNQERRECKRNLNRAEGQRGFKKIKDTEQCKKALETCTCDHIRNDTEGLCASIRK